MGARGGAEPAEIGADYMRASIRLVQVYFWPHARAAPPAEAMQPGAWVILHVMMGSLAEHYTKAADQARLARAAVARVSAQQPTKRQNRRG